MSVPSNLIYYRENDNDLASPFGDLAYETLVVQDGPPTGFWKLDETSGITVYDSSGNHFDGTINSGVTLAQFPAIASGYSAKFDGSSGCCVVGHNAALDAQSGEFAIEMWAKFTGTAYGMAFGKFDSFSPYPGPTVWFNYQNGAQTTGYIQFQQVNSSGNYVSTISSGLNDGVWRYYVFQRRNYSGTYKLEIYINGVLDNSITLASVQNCGDTGQLYFGSRCGLQYINGTFDEVAFYVGKSLSATQILNHSRAR